MPYTGIDDPKLPTNVQKLDADKRKKWVEVFNKTHDNCKKIGGADAKCDPIAFRMANGTIKKELIEGGEGEKYIDAPEQPMMYTPYGGAESFEEIDQYMKIQDQEMATLQVTYEVEALMRNVMHSEDVESRPSKLQKIVDGFRTRVGKAGKRKEQTAYTIAQVSQAIKALLPGYIGEPSTLITVKAIAEAIPTLDATEDQKANLAQRLTQAKMSSGAFQILKAKDGSLRWTGIPSNKWRDRDNPPQIIEESAHKEFVEYLDSTKDWPALLSWHTPGTRIGVADWVDYSNGFLVMGGPIDKDKYPEAKALAEKCQAEDVGMSHGFVYTHSDKQKEIIGRYRMWEVSHLPKSKAANVWTSFNLLTKEAKQMFDPEKRKYLVGLHGEDTVKRLEDNVDTLKKDLDSLGVEFKELAPEIDMEKLTKDVAEAIIGAEGFKALITSVREQGEALTAVKAAVEALGTKVTTVEGMAKDTAEKSKKSVDELISSALSPTAKTFQPSKDGPGLTPEEKEAAAKSAPSTFIEPAMMAGLFGTPK